MWWKHLVRVCTWIQFSSACLDECYSENNNSWADSSFEVTCTIWWGAHCRGDPKSPRCFPSLAACSTTHSTSFPSSCGPTAAQRLSFSLWREKPKLGPQWGLESAWERSPGPSPAYWQGQRFIVEGNTEMQVAKTLEHEAPLPRILILFQVTAAAIGHPLQISFSSCFGQFLVWGEGTRSVRKRTPLSRSPQGWSCTSAQPGCSHAVNRNDQSCPKSQLDPSDGCNLAVSPEFSTHCTDVPFLQGNRAAENNVTLHQLGKAQKQSALSLALCFQGFSAWTCIYSAEIKK